ncbi:heme peroxidase [Mycena rosella]|uniref:Peroxidase n=1 Tax=Mycena rosella TaxID=1033263 RepID=A0AAD7GKR4_MYCRO|nr:heme peroxidase [Mycena rosella]
MLNLPLSLVSCFLLWAASVRGADYQWPSLQYDALEEFLYEGTRPDGSSMAELVQPCKMRGGTNTTVAAEWVRLVYHDVATHNASDGTGGLDGSIFFETNRTENVGAGMTNSLSDFQAFPNKYVTRADLIAIATVWAVATCSGPVIPLRGGRIDAEAAGPTGVPDPGDSLQSLTDNFAKQGFNVSEMIQLVACGHTLGGVRYPDFPTIVSAGSNPSDSVVDLFDDTQQFDHNIITQYLDGTTKDPLIVLNQTMASDRRVFGADNNVTMQSMSTADSFSSTCVTIFDKMLNTVPSSVTLTDEIALLPVKVSAVQLTVGTTQMQFQASVRIIQSSTSTTVKMYWCDRYGDAANCTSGLKRFAAPGSSSTVASPTSNAMNVTLKKYQFVVPIDASQSVAKFWFVVDYGNGTTLVADNGGGDYVVDQDDVLWVPRLSTAKSVLTGQSGTLVTAAVKNTSTPSRVYMDCFGRATANYIAVNATYDLALNTSIPAVAGYNFYTGTATDDFGLTMSFDLYSVAANGTAAVDEYRQAGLIGVALAAVSTVNTTTSSSVGGASGASGAGRAGPSWGVLGLLGVWTLANLQ